MRKALMLSTFTLLCLVFETGCGSYFKRKDCEEINWYEHGQKVALSGRRLSGDDVLSECKRVETEIPEGELDRGFKLGLEKYCQPSQAFATGKSGEPFSNEMCEGENLSILIAKHAAGVAEFCQRSNGFSVGARGKAYNGICPKQLESAFLPEFNRGRRSFLAEVLSYNEQRISSIDRDISRMEAEAHQKSWEAQKYLVPQLVTETVYDPVSRQYMSQNVWKVTDERKRRADDLNWSVQSIRSDIERKRKEQMDLRERNREIRIESLALEAPAAG